MYFKKIYKPTNNNLRTSSNSRNKNVNMTSLFKNDNQSRQFWNQRTVNVAGARKIKPKMVKDSVYHKEKMLLGKQAKQGVPLQAEQYDWLADMDEEVDEQELEAHYSYMDKIQEVPTPDTGIDSKPVEQKANTTLAQELKECKAILAKTSKSLGESISVRDSCLVALQTKQTEFEKYTAFNDYTVDYDKFEHALAELQCLYLHKVKECDCLTQKLLKQTESVTKKVHTELLQRFAKVEKQLISLEITLQKCKEQAKNDTVCNGKASIVFRKEREQYFEIQDLKAQLQDKNIASVPKANVSKGLSKPDIAQTLPQTTKKACILVLENPKVKRTNRLQHTIKKVASKSTNLKPQSYFRVLYENTNKAWKWWIEQQSPSGYKGVPKPKKQWVPKAKRQWVPKAKNDHVQKRIVQVILFIVDSGCTKHMTGNLKLVYYIEGFNHNLFSVGQFCDADLEVAFRKSTCFVRDLQGNDLLTGNRRSDLYTISIQESTSLTPLCLMAKATPT
nr:retrovirus-related Pol polyprotein from transposon TNT 1-94 [Tanacetum cinerariifolium]